MPDRFSELLEKAQSGQLTPEESEELARILNAPVLPPSGDLPPGFVSKHTFEPSDLPTRIGTIGWFSNCGGPLALDLTMEIDRVRSWPMAMQACQSAAWENVELEARNQLTVWLHRNDLERYQAWNDIVTVHKTEVVTPLIKEKLVPFQLEGALDPIFVDSTAWDVLGALMENSYLSSGHQAYFFLELLWIYEAGHFPCGWLGNWPSGRLVVY
jgi:hypothetical protein